MCFVVNHGFLQVQMLFSVSFRLLFQFELGNFHLRAFCHLLAVEGFDITLHAFAQMGAADGSERLAPACHNDLCHTCYAVGTCSDARVGIVGRGLGGCLSGAFRLG